MHVPVTTTAGEPVEFHVQISTPKEASAPAIEPDLPTLVFIHGVYMAQQIFESAWCARLYLVDESVWLTMCVYVQPSSTTPAYASSTSSQLIG